MDSTWTCEDCGVMVHRNFADEASEEWTRAFIAGHEDLHGAQLLEHDGDREALRRRLRNPSLHAAIGGPR